MVFSDYIVYADESGDHGLESIDPDYPIFVLCFCVFSIEKYVSNVVPNFQNLKFKHFGHDSVVLHSHEIRKRKGPFEFLNTKVKEEAFLPDLSQAINHSEFSIICCAIDKRLLLKKYTKPSNPYDIALIFCLEQLHMFLHERENIDLRTHVVIEKRGNKEDDELELVFRRTVQNGTQLMPPGRNFEPLFVDKKTNSTGLQIADLVCYPIGRKVLDPSRKNQPFDIIEPKLTGILKEDEKRLGYKGIGLKIFP